MPTNKFKISISPSLLLALLFNTSALFAQTVIVPPVVEGNKQSAGFSFTKTGKEKNTRTISSTKPLIHYQQNIHMLSATNDMPSLQVFGNGQVLIHYPAYMKKAGDYVMHLDEAELIALIRSISGNGLMEFNERDTRAKINADRKALRAKGQFYAISDAVETTVEIRLDEYQKNKASKKIKNFYKKFKWKNIEHDAARYKNHSEITRANDSVVHLKDLMKDVRLEEVKQR